MKHKNLLKIIIMLSILMFFIIVITSIYHDKQNLGGDYYYLPIYEAVYIGYPDKISLIYKSDKKYVFNNVIVKGDIKNIKYDNDFIVFEKKLNNGTFQCFIIIKNSESIYGPFSSKEFSYKLLELNIPKFLSCL